MKTSTDTINKVCNESQILLLREHWLNPDELSLISQLNPNFSGFGLSSMCLDDKLITGRPYGGVGILWQKSFSQKVIPSVDQCKYLGIIINVKNCDADLKRQMRKYYANANMLLSKFSYYSSDLKCCVFKSYCSTMYCSSMWFDSTVTSTRKLKIAYNNGLRRILNLPKYNSASEMFVNLNIPSFDELLQKFVYSFKSRIQGICNSLVNGIVKSSVPLFS